MFCVSTPVGLSSCGLCNKVTFYLNVAFAFICDIEGKPSKVLTPSNSAPMTSRQMVNVKTVNGTLILLRLGPRIDCVCLGDSRDIDFFHTDPVGKVRIISLFEPVRKWKPILSLELIGRI